MKLNKLMAAAMAVGMLTVGQIEKAEAGITYAVTGSVPGLRCESVLLLDQNSGNFYGTTSDNLTNYGGTLFETDENGNSTVLYTFTIGDTTNGYTPYGTLVQEGDHLYGTTSDYNRGNSSFGGGHVFDYNTATHTYTPLYAFTGGSDGRSPFGGVILVPGSSDVYGITYVGGPSSTNAFGSIYAVKKSGGLDWSVDLGKTNGALPLYTSLTYYPSDNCLYGVTATYGKLGHGAVFKVNVSTHVITDVHDFAGGTNGGRPFSTLVLGPDNILRGTWADEPSGVFAISNGVYSIVHTFGNTTTVLDPTGLTLTPNGQYLGVFQSALSLGGTNYGGGLFFMTPNGNTSFLINFPTNNLITGTVFAIGLAFGTNGNIFITGQDTTNILQVGIPFPSTALQAWALNSNTVHAVFSAAINQMYNLRVWTNGLTAPPYVLTNTAGGGTFSADITASPLGYTFVCPGVDSTNGIPPSFATNMFVGFIYPPFVGIGSGIYSLGQLPSVYNPESTNSGTTNGFPTLPQVLVARRFQR